MRTAELQNISNKGEYIPGSIGLMGKIHVLIWNPTFGKLLVLGKICQFILIVEANKVKEVCKSMKRLINMYNKPVNVLYLQTKVPKTDEQK